VVLVNQVRNRLAALSLLDRSLKATSDEELAAMLDALDDEHASAVASIAEMPETTAENERVAFLRAAAQRGRINGILEQLAFVITDRCLADCVTALGDASDNPSEEQLRAVLPNLVETHGVPMVRFMLASAVAGEAKASPILNRMLKTDEVFALPPVEMSTTPDAPQVADDPEREQLRAQRKERKRQQQAEARARREQAEAARRRR